MSRTTGENFGKNVGEQIKESYANANALENRSIAKDKNTENSTGTHSDYNANSTTSPNSKVRQNSESNCTTGSASSTTDNRSTHNVPPKNDNWIPAGLISSSSFENTNNNPSRSGV